MLPSTCMRSRASIGSKCSAHFSRSRGCQTPSEPGCVNARSPTGRVLGAIPLQKAKPPGSPPDISELFEPGPQNNIQRYQKPRNLKRKPYEALEPYTLHRIDAIDAQPCSANKSFPHIVPSKPYMLSTLLPVNPTRRPSNLNRLC